MFTRILVATDGSACAAKAVEAAAELAKQFGARLSVLTVFTPPAPTLLPYPTEMGTVDPAIVERWAEETKLAVEARTTEILDSYQIDYLFTQETGHPADCIVRTAEANDCDLIVLGSRGLSGIRSFLLGSVSDRVSHHAHSPVLIVK